jgi:hypothetical protein
MSKVIHEVKVANGRYTNKEGVEKTRYLSIGKVIETKKGPMLKLDSIPVLDEHWSGWAYLFDPKKTEEPEPDNFPY